MYKDVFSVVNRVHGILETYISPGDAVVDATAGQGNDTLFLAQLVGDKGKVWAFDIQEAACAATKEKLAQRHIDWAEVICDNHANLARHVQTPIKAGLFNLGYLPGADHNVITKGTSTLAAIQSMMEFLLPGGVIVLVCYLGHIGGQEEYAMIKEALTTAPALDWCVEEFRFINKKLAPRVIMVKKSLKEDL